MCKYLTIIILTFLLQLFKAQTISVLWSDGDNQIFDNKRKSWIKINNDDEINFSDKINLNNESSILYLRISDIGNFKVSGKQNAKTIKELYENQIKNKSTEVSIWNSIINIFYNNSEEGYGVPSLVSRDIDKDLDSNKLKFYITNEIDVLKGEDVILFWQSNHIKNDIYKLKFSRYDFENFKVKDSVFDTSDTIITLNLSDFICDDCSLEISDPNNKYQFNKIKIYNNKSLSDSSYKIIKEIDQLIKKYPTNNSFKIAKIKILVNEGFIANAHYYFLNYLSEDNVDLNNEYHYFLNSINNNSK